MARIIYQSVIKFIKSVTLVNNSIYSIVYDLSTNIYFYSCYSTKIQLKQSESTTTTQI